MLLATDVSIGIVISLVSSEISVVCRPRLRVPKKRRAEPGFSSEGIGCDAL